jgi:hypothetical protein
MQRDTLSCILPIVWSIGWASEIVHTLWQTEAFLHPVENRTSFEPVITIRDIHDLQESYKNSVFVYHLTDCRIYKDSGSFKYYRTQVTNDAKGRVCNLGSGAELWMETEHGLF